MIFFADPANSAIWSTYAPFATEVASYNTNYSNLAAFIPNKDVITTGITSDKNRIKKEGADALIIIMDKTRAYALHYGKAALAAQMHTNSADIAHLDDEDYQPYFQAICASINTNAMPDPNYAPYGVVAGDITAVLATAATFDNLIGDAKTLASTATVANTDINGAIKILHDNIVQFDLLINHWAVSNPNFVEAYHINSAVDNIPIRHTGIEGVVSGPVPPDNATAVPISGVSVKLVGLNKTAVTDLLGHFSIVRVKTGTYQLEVSKTGYRTATSIIHIRRGHIESDNIQIVPA